MVKLGIGVGVLSGVLAALALVLASCGRSATESRAELEEPGAGGESSDPNPGPSHGEGGQFGAEGGFFGGGNQDPGHPEGGAPATGGAPAEEPCEPGARTCDGPTVRVCDEDGAGSTIDDLCSLSQTCSDGECQDIECVPGETFCRGRQIAECNADGTGGELSEDCAADEYCIERDGQALCSPSPCVADEPLCLNQVATSCKADGSGPEPGGINCGTQGAACVEGECVNTTCTPGDRLCQHDDVYVCLGSGADAVLFAECDANESCDPDLAACRTKICEPGKLGCDSTRIAKCNALGLGWEQLGTDCSATDQMCIAGACKTQTCVPSSTFCKNNDVYACDADGVSSALSQECTDYNNHCAPYYYSNTAYCTYNACTPGASYCNGNVLTTCNDEGSGPSPGGTDCGSDQICYANTSCAAKICNPYQYFCSNGDVAYCYDGLSSYVQQDCGADARCVSDSGSFSCKAYDCTPGLKACLGNKLGTCGDDGLSLSVTQDCTATSEVCTSTTACGTTAVDTLGDPEELLSFGADYVFGDVIDVQSHRKLTELQVNIVLAGPRTLRWVVFEQVGQYYEARYDKVVDGQTGSGYVSSGPLDYTLKAGHRYALAVAVTGGGYVPYYDAQPWSPNVSFGRAVGSFYAQYYASVYAYLQTNLLYDMRVTTELP